MRQFLYRLIVELTNGKWTSFLLRKFAQSRLSGFFVSSFARVYKINLEEAEYPLSEYKTLHHFFTRKLKKGARIIHESDSSVISPVDGVIEAFGTISKEMNMEVKGKSYSLLDMLGSEEKVSKYESGSFMIIYLSPSNYHRIHSPFSGKVTDRLTLGRKSYPVNSLGLKYGKETLSKNFRRITEFQHRFGHSALIKVGAMFVNSIEMTFEGDTVEKGEEIAYFSFGSTVILLFEKETFEIRKDLKIPSEIKMGEALGFLKETK